MRLKKLISSILFLQAIAGAAVSVHASSEPTVTIGGVVEKRRFWADNKVSGNVAIAWTPLYGRGLEIYSSPTGILNLTDDQLRERLLDLAEDAVANSHGAAEDRSALIQGNFENVKGGTRPFLLGVLPTRKGRTWGRELITFLWLLEPGQAITEREIKMFQAATHKVESIQWQISNAETVHSKTRYAQLRDALTGNGMGTTWNEQTLLSGEAPEFKFGSRFETNLKFTTSGATVRAGLTRVDDKSKATQAGTAPSTKSGTKILFKADSQLSSQAPTIRIGGNKKFAGVVPEFEPGNVILKLRTANVDYDIYSDIPEALTLVGQGKPTNRDFQVDLFNRSLTPVLGGLENAYRGTNILLIANLQDSAGKIRPSLSVSLRVPWKQGSRPMNVDFTWVLEPGQRITEREIHLMERASAQMVAIQHHLHNKTLDTIHNTAYVTLKKTLAEMGLPQEWTPDTQWKIASPIALPLSEFRLAKIYRTQSPVAVGIAPARLPVVEVSRDQIGKRSDLPTVRLGGNIERLDKAPNFDEGNVVVETRTLEREHELFADMSEKFYFEDNLRQDNAKFQHDLLIGAFNQFFGGYQNSYRHTNSLALGHLQDSSGAVRPFLTTSLKSFVKDITGTRPVTINFTWVLEANQKITPREILLMERASAQLLVVQYHLHTRYNPLDRTPPYRVLSDVLKDLGLSHDWTPETKWNYTSSLNEEQIRYLREFKFTRFFRAPEPIVLSSSSGKLKLEEVTREDLGLVEALPKKVEIVPPAKKHSVRPEVSTPPGSHSPASAPAPVSAPTPAHTNSHLRVGGTAFVATAVLGGATYWAYKKFHKSRPESKSAK